MPNNHQDFDYVEKVGVNDGPTVALLGGVHGDEEEGVLAVLQVLVALTDEPLQHGHLRAVPVANGPLTGRPHVAARSMVGTSRVAFPVRPLARPPSGSRGS